VGDDTFLTLRSEGCAQTRVMGSRFLGRAVPLEEIEDLESVLEHERKRYYDASHWCFAARVGHGESFREKSSDAGEPRGTAGQPMLREIQRRQLTDCAVIVTRYFGGAKLGTGNLGRAYAECAGQALDSAGSLSREILDVVHVDCSYDDQGIVYHLARQLGATIEPRDDGDQAAFALRVPRRQTASLMQRLIDDSSGRIRAGRAGQWIS